MFEKFFEVSNLNLVEEKLKTLPENPGVYLMKNSQGKIIYVGKAKILKNRVRQYFQQNKNHSPKVLAMVKKISDFAGKFICQSKFQRKFVWRL